ncbi:MAG: hypothetical protein ACXWC4_00685 [Telluria sp.]
MKKIVSLLLLSMWLVACDESPEAKQVRVAERAVDICHENLKNETDAGAKAIIEGSCRVLEAEYEKLKHK